MVDKWNEKLKSLAANLDRSVAVEDISTKRRTFPPFAHIRQLAAYLYDSLAAHWKCACVQHRSAKFLLQTHDHVREEDEKVPFQLLFAPQLVVAPSQAQRRWFEGKVVVHSPSSKGSPKVRIQGTASQISTSAALKQRLSDICEALELAEKYSHRMCLAVEHDASSNTVLWRQQAEQCQLVLTEKTRETTLADVLCDFSQNLRARSCKAVQLAHSLIQLYETAWFDAKWSKDQISFLEAAPSQIDLERPYVTVDFPRQASTPLAVDLSQFHENFGILSLGVVLIEMHCGRSMEELRIPEDLKCSSTIDCNALFRIADRVFDKIHLECSPNYKKAIKACLQIRWKVAGQPVSLLDESTRQEVWKHIIVPLEKDMSFLGGRIVA